MKKDNLFWALGILAIYGLTLPGRAHAYLDPGTGSYLFQILIAGLIGGLFAVKIFWVKIKLFFLNLFGKKTEEDPEGSEDAGDQKPE